MPRNEDLNDNLDKLSIPLPLDLTIPPEEEMFPSRRRGLDYLFEAQRKRRLPGQPKELRIIGATNDVDAVLPDAVTETLQYTWVLPFDWVYGTPLEFHVLFDSGAAGTLNMVWNSQLGIVKFGVARSTVNLENVSAIVQALTSSIQTEIVRGGVSLMPTLTSLITDVSNDYIIIWTIGRQGAHASDNLTGTVFVRHCWLEYYSTYDYQNSIND